MNHDVPFRLDGKVAAVVGAASGIGAAVAAACARLGARVVRLDVEADKAGQVAQRIAAADGLAESATVDIRDGHAVHAAFDGVRQRHGRFDVAVCTPSVNVRKPLLSYSEEEFERVVTLNLRGSFNVLR